MGITPDNMYGTIIDMTPPKIKKPKRIPKHLIDKRNEWIWSLAIQQDYNASEIALMANLHRSSVHDIIKKLPEGWASPWQKIK